jgi:hypothetical protein
MRTKNRAITIGGFSKVQTEPFQVIMSGAPTKKFAGKIEAPGFGISGTI